MIVRPQRYSLGFLFNYILDCAYWVHKSSPDWQAGLYNGLGGKFLDASEHPMACMVRTANKELGLPADDRDIKWYQIGEMLFPAAQVNVFAGATQKCIDIDKAEEIVVCLGMEELREYAEKGKLVPYAYEFFMAARDKMRDPSRPDLWTLDCRHHPTPAVRAA